MVWEDPGEHQPDQAGRQERRGHHGVGGVGVLQPGHQQGRGEHREHEHQRPQQVQRRGQPRTAPGLGGVGRGHVALRQVPHTAVVLQRLHQHVDQPRRQFAAYYGVSKAAIEALGSLYHSRFGMDVIVIRVGTLFESPLTLGKRGLVTWLSPDDGAPPLRGVPRLPVSRVPDHLGRLRQHPTHLLDRRGRGARLQVARQRGDLPRAVRGPAGRHRDRRRVRGRAVLHRAAGGFQPDLGSARVRHR